ncbi:MAG: hypothetical protein ABW208_03640 [Pyrinomonadaceae bacterium]
MSLTNNSFRKGFALAAVAALLLSQAAGARGAVPQRVPFKISSLGSAFAVQLEVEGTYTVNENYVEVNVERVYLYVSEKCPYQGRRFINTLSVALGAVNPNGRWEIENRSLPLFVEHVMSPRDEYRLAGLYFQIPRNAGADLTKRWLIVETEETAPDLPDDKKDEKGYAFAHSRRNLFETPFKDVNADAPAPPTDNDAVAPSSTRGRGRRARG